MLNYIYFFKFYLARLEVGWHQLFCASSEVCICFGFQKPELLLPGFFTFWQNYNGKWLPLQGVIFRLTALQLRMAKRIIFPFL